MEAVTTTHDAECCDHRSGVRNEAKQRGEFGHERIAFISGLHEILALSLRLMGFRELLEEVPVRTAIAPVEHVALGSSGAFRP